MGSIIITPMNVRKFLPVLLLVVLAAILLSAGCSSEAPTDTGAQQETTSATSSQAVVLQPGPTDIPPTGYGVVVTVIRNPISTNPSITVTFAGGDGWNMVKKDGIRVKITRSDGKIVEGTLENNLDSSVTLEGSTGEDRVEVWADMVNGETYKIYDEVMKFKARTTN